MPNANNKDADQPVHLQLSRPACLTLLQMPEDRFSHDVAQSGLNKAIYNNSKGSRKLYEVEHTKGAN